jgi:GTPase SAR1 family protein
MENFKVEWNESENPRNHNKLLPNSFRALIIGKSNCGKTSLLINMLLQNDWLDYNRLYIVGNSLFQPKYDIIKEGFNNGLFKDQIRRIFALENKIKDQDLTYKDVIDALKTTKTVEVKFLTPTDLIPGPEELDRNYKNLIIFDDIMEEKSQEKPKSYYTRGRHSSVDSIYISQN